MYICTYILTYLVTYMFCTYLGRSALPGCQAFCAVSAYWMYYVCKMYVATVDGPVRRGAEPCLDAARVPIL